jgi:Fis family transcriptional regulator
MTDRVSGIPQSLWLRHLGWALFENKKDLGYPAMKNERALNRVYFAEDQRSMEDAINMEAQSVGATFWIAQDRVDPNEPLRNCVKNAVENYLSDLKGYQTSDLYRLVMDEVEAPLLEAVMRYSRGNHSKASSLLGINRGTLRKKLRQHDLE